MTTLVHLLRSDLGVATAGAIFMAGWVCGVLFLAVVCWRRLARPDGEERRLRLALEDADAQIVNLYRGQDRMVQILAARASIGADHWR